MFLPYFISVSGSSCTCRSACGATAPAFGIGGVGQESGEEGWALGRSSICEGARDGLGNLLSLCGYGCGERGPALWGRWGQVKGLSLLPGPGDSLLFFLFPRHSGGNEGLERASPSFAQDHTYIPFRAQPGFDPPGHLVSKPVPWGLLGRRAGQPLNPHLQRTSLRHREAASLTRGPAERGWTLTPGSWGSCHGPSLPG